MLNSLCRSYAISNFRRWATCTFLVKIISKDDEVEGLVDEASTTVANDGRTGLLALSLFGERHNRMFLARSRATVGLPYGFVA